MDHFKECYEPDLKAMEALGLIRKGTVVVADNVVFRTVTTHPYKQTQT
jgi:predicted O-methyltransferase YrrM